MSVKLLQLARGRHCLPKPLCRITQVSQCLGHKDSSMPHFTMIGNRVLPSRYSVCLHVRHDSSLKSAEGKKSESDTGCYVNQNRVIRTRARYYSKSPLSDYDLRRSVEGITERFGEARQMLDDAKSSHGTEYFSEDLKEARETVQETLADYGRLLDSVSDEQKLTVQRTIGLRMEELKAQQISLEELARE